MKTKESAWVRELIERDTGGEPLGEKLKGLRGSLDSSPSRKTVAHPLAKRIRENNWRK